MLAQSTATYYAALRPTIRHDKEADEYVLEFPTEDEAYTESSRAYISSPVDLDELTSIRSVGTHRNKFTGELEPVHIHHRGREVRVFSYVPEATAKDWIKCRNVQFICLQQNFEQKFFASQLILNRDDDDKNFLTMTKKMY